jgi:hypothetical protein
MSDIFKGGVENIDGNVHANGSISAGDLVELTGDDQVEAASTNGADGYGVAMYDATSGDAVAVATVGAKVVVNSTGVTAGDLVTSNGGNTAGQVQTANSTGDEIVGRALTGTSGGTCEVLLAMGGEIN